MGVRRWIRRNRFPLFISFIFLSALTVLNIIKHANSKDHFLSEDLVHYTPEFTTGEHVLLSPREARSVCKANGFSNYKKRGRKVYDLVLLNTELDWLEIRLHATSPYVDYFVIVESPTTFTSRSKPLYLKENWSKFEAYHHKIIYRVVHDPIVSTRIWDHEDWFRDSMLYEVFPGIVGTPQEAQYGDVLLVSDMDEIVRPGALLLLRYCNIPNRLTLRTDFFYYSYQWRHRGQQWHHPDATIYRGSNTISPNRLRQGLLGPGWFVWAAFRRWWDRATLFNAGWHCSSCFATVAEMRTKMHSFAHQGWNTADNRQLDVLLHRVRHGLDLFGRDGEIYDRVENNTDVPEYILQQYRGTGRFGYMLNRDGPDAGFEDWSSVMQHQVHAPDVL